MKVTPLSSETQGSVFTILSGLLYGLIGYFGTTLINADMSISTMTFWRFLTATLFIGLIYLKYFNKQEIQRQQFIQAFLAGALFYSFSTIAYFMASQHIGTGLAMVIFFTFPVFVMLLNWIFYHSTPPRIYYIAIGIIFIGVALLANIHTLQFDFVGIGLAMISALLYAAYILYSKKIQLKPVTATLMISFGCTCACLIFSLFNHSFSSPDDLNQWLHIIGFGTISTAIAILLLLKGLQTISAEKAAILSVLEPVFVLIFGILLLDETVTLSQTIGALIILSGAILTLLSNKPSNHQHKN